MYIDNNIRNNIINTKITDIQIADHRGVDINIILPEYNRWGRSYWKLNNSVLQDDEYRDVIKNLWTRWKERKDELIQNMERDR